MRPRYRSPPPRLRVCLVPRWYFGRLEPVIVRMRRVRFEYKAWGRVSSLSTWEFRGESIDFFFGSGRMSCFGARAIS